MAINRVQEPANPPTAIGDWTKIIAEMRAVALGIEMPLRVIGSNIVKGAVFQIGGTIYLADADTAISGSASNYVKLTPSGDGSTCAASYVSSLTGVAWNSTYCGWYDSGSPACFYEFDEGKAFTAGQIAAIRRNRDVTIPMGTGWLGILAAAAGANWATALAASAGAGILAQLLTVDGTGSNLDADYFRSLAPGNGIGNIPISNGFLCTNLVANYSVNADVAAEAQGLDRSWTVGINGNYTKGQIYTLLSDELPLAIGEKVTLSGKFTITGGALGFASYAERTSSTEITIHGCLASGAYDYEEYTAGDATVHSFVLSWQGHA